MNFNTQLRTRLEAENTTGFQWVRYGYVIENQHNEFMIALSDEASNSRTTYGNTWQFVGETHYASDLYDEDGLEAATACIRQYTGISPETVSLLDCQLRNGILHLTFYARLLDTAGKFSFWSDDHVDFAWLPLLKIRQKLDVEVDKEVLNKPEFIRRHITDIWFRTELSLPALAGKLGLVNIWHDIENHWEWVLGELDGTTLDLTRTHTQPAAETDARIFIYSGRLNFPLVLLDTLIIRLGETGIRPVHLGVCNYVGGNDFYFDETETVE